MISKQPSVRRLRRSPLLLVTSAILIACSPPAGSSGVPSRAGQPGASSGSGGGGGSGGSITYQISGDYSASGELPFLAHSLTRFENGIWIVYFATGVNATTFFQVNTNPNNPIMNFVNPDISTTSLGTNPGDCTFTITSSDASGTSGSFACHAIAAVNKSTSTTVSVDLTASWDAHP